LSIFIGGRVLDAVTASSGLEAGPRAAVAVGIVFLVVASLTLIAVRPRVGPRRGPPDLAPAGAA
jgi:hypothetical protein